MGKDAYLFRISAPDLDPEKTYQGEDLNERSILFFPVADAEDEINKNLVPFTTRVNVTVQNLYNEDLAKHLSMESPSIGVWFGNGDISVSDAAKPGSPSIVVSREGVLALCREETSPHLAFLRERLAYWKNDDDVTDLMAGYYPDLDNCGYYPVTEALLEELKKLSSSPINVDYEPGLFYFEWY